MNLPPRFQDAPKVVPAQPPIILVGLPTRGRISVETFSALQFNHDGFRLAPMTTARMPIVQARNAIAKQMLQAAASCPLEPKPSDIFCLWVDSDAWWGPKTIAQAVAILWNNPKVDLLSGSFSTRLPFAPRIAYRNESDPHSFPKPGIDCQMSDLVECERVGFHFVMHRISLLEKVGENPFNADEGCGEDASFCRRVRKTAGHIYCAVGLMVAHVDPNDGSAYVPGEPALKFENNNLIRTTHEHMVPKTAEVRKYGLPG